MLIKPISVIWKDSWICAAGSMSHGFTVYRLWSMQVQPFSVSIRPKLSCLTSACTVTPTSSIFHACKKKDGPQEILLSVQWHIAEVRDRWRVKQWCYQTPLMPKPGKFQFPLLCQCGASLACQMCKKTCRWFFCFFCFNCYSFARFS